MIIAAFNRHSPDEQSLRRPVDLVNISSFPALRKDGPRHAKTSLAAAKPVFNGAFTFHPRRLVIL
jgi:hypothetical protein